MVDSEYFGKLPGKAELSAISNEEASLVYSADGILPKTAPTSTGKRFLLISSTP